MMIKIVGLFTFIALSVFILQGCSGGRALSFVSITQAKHVKRDVVYEPAKQLTADIYYAKPLVDLQQDKKTAGLEQPETVIFIFGGGWYKGDKRDYGFVADALLARGFNVVMPNYRLFPEAAYPSYIEELEAFMGWFANNAQSLGLSTSAVHLMGHSAGAYNIAMYLLGDTYKKPFALESFVGLAGPYDFFLPTPDPKYIPVFTRNGDYNQPAHMPAKQDPANLSQVLGRALLVHGDKDTTVTPKNLKSFSAYLAARDIPVETQLIEGMGHVGAVSHLNNVPLFKSDMRNTIMQFLQQ